MKKLLYLIVFSIITWSCIDKEVYVGEQEQEQEQEQVPDSVPEPDPDPVEGYKSYLYPYDMEAHNIVAEISLVLNDAPEISQVNTEIPVLKYNKSWLFMLTQDDCDHSTYSTTWAAINGRPLSNNHYYNAEQLAVGDLPPDIYTLKQGNGNEIVTLGSTDGAGNEVRFAFTATLRAEEQWMDRKPVIQLGFTDNFYRFNKYSGLTWSNVAEMLAYDTGLAFHDFIIEAKNQIDSLLEHFEIAQRITTEKLSGRGIKVLAEPDGNHNYLLAARNFSPIRIMTAQNTNAGGPVVKPLYPHNVESDLSHEVLQRSFYEPFEIYAHIENELSKPIKERKALNAGIHSTGSAYASFLLWLNNNYGKDGDDSVWFPSLEEYYEYNYYRVNSTIDHEIIGDTLKLRISLPSEQYFYYPSVTVNLSGIAYDQIKRVISDDVVTGLSYASYDGGVMLNIDCRRFLNDHAEHFVEKYLHSQTESNRLDAIYFVEKLKESAKKEELRKRIPDYN